MALNPKDQELVASLVGRTITRADWFNQNPDDSLDTDEACRLWLDDGRIIELGSIGYDGANLTIQRIELIDVASCLHCGRPHVELQVLDDWRTGSTERDAYCPDHPNNVAWTNSAQNSPPPVASR